VRTVLVINKDDFGRETLARLLELTGFHALRAAPGRRALETLAGGLRPGLVVLDLVIPQVDARQFRARQTCDPHLADVPVIVLSATEAKREPSPFAGIVAHFQKPVAVRELLDAIGEHCRS
jgi:CheY-like chemotaxis protein